MILLIDHFDSFVFNLASYFQELNHDIRVIRQDKVSLALIRKLQPTHLILSPGPCSPDKASISLEVVQAFRGIIPILGVCLGHQIIGQALGGKIIRAKRPLHGQESLVYHTGQGLFSELPSPYTVGRYHSLIVSDEGLSDELQVVARSEEGEIMAFVNVEEKLAGVQFHPESVLTKDGHRLLANFLQL